MPIPIALAAALAPTIYKGIQGLFQGDEADNLKKRDTTPPAFAEALGLGRQAAASLGLPGSGTAINRIEAGTNDTLSAATRAGNSSSSVLGLLEQADASKQKALNDLGAREDSYHERKTHELTGLLAQEAGYQDRDQQEFDRNRAALRESSKRNLFGAVDEGSQIALQFLGQQGKTPGGGTTPAAGYEDGPLSTRGGLSPVGPDSTYPAAGRRRYNQYGIYDPGIY